ncbi:MAG: flavodoxin domain-containing protein [Chloroflexota bacterium]
MRVLVTAASRHGATAEIADEIGRVIQTDLGEGNDVDVIPAERVESVEEYDAVVLGSAVYMGHWLEPARELARRHADEMRQRPVWLFSSGPIGDPPKPTEDPVDVSEAMELAGAQEHRVFAGKLDRAKLGFGEKAIVIALRAPAGDFRDWEEIAAWARGVSSALKP